VGGVGGFAGIPATSITFDGKPSFPLFWTDHPLHGQNYGFFAFLKIFYLGDHVELINHSSKGTSGQFMLNEDILANENDRQALLGDQLKNTLFLHLLRQLPIATGIPILCTLAMVLLDIFNLILPKKKIVLECTSLGPTLQPLITPTTGNRECPNNQRTRRSIRYLDEETVIYPRTGSTISDSLSSLSTSVLTGLAKYADQHDSSSVYESIVSYMNPIVKMVDSLKNVGSCINLISNCPLQNILKGQFPCQKNDINYCLQVADDVSNFF